MAKVKYVEGVNSFTVSRATLNQFEAAIISDIANVNKGGQFFTVWFKKADGSLRKMNCRTGVKRYLKGGISTVSGKANILPVYDVQNAGYRCFKGETIERIRHMGKELIFKD